MAVVIYAGKEKAVSSLGISSVFCLQFIFYNKNGTLDLNQQCIQASAALFNSFSSFNRWAGITPGISWCVLCAFFYSKNKLYLHPVQPSAPLFAENKFLLLSSLTKWWWYTVFKILYFVYILFFHSKITVLGVICDAYWQLMYFFTDILSCWLSSLTKWWYQKNIKLSCFVYILFIHNNTTVPAFSIKHEELSATFYTKSIFC